MVFTAKHHEGFAMYKSDVSKFNVVDATPFGRDVVGELAEACYKHNFKLGLYYSQDLDWSHPNGGGWPAGKTWYDDRAYFVNNWDFPEDDKKDYSVCFEEKIKPQVKEILTKYGDVCLIWFDTPCTISKEQTDELYNLVKTYQPDCLINSRIGNGYGDYHSTDDNDVEFDSNGNTKVKTGLYECPATLNDTWGYKSFDNNWKSPEEVLRLKNSLNAKGINYLLNVGPDYLGRFPAPAVDILLEVGKKL